MIDVVFLRTRTICYMFEHSFVAHRRVSGLPFLASESLSCGDQVLWLPRQAAWLPRQAACINLVVRQPAYRAYCAMTNVRSEVRMIHDILNVAWYVT